jgi:arginyl-tRNA synthetase
LAALVEAALDAPAGTAVVHACEKRAVGDFKVDTRPLLGVDGVPDKATCAAAAERLAGVDGIERAVPVTPNVYLTASVDFLTEHVVAGVLGQRPSYGSGGRGDAADGDGRTVQVQFSCPNMNKALHLGHLRTNVLGMALANAMAATGWHVVRSDQPSDWGRHIAKAVLTYRRHGRGTTPASAGRKPDHFVGDFYVAYDAEAEGAENELARVVAGLEAGDPELLDLNRRLTTWAFDGIRQTYVRLGTWFDVTLREGDTIGLARSLIGREVGRACHRRDDGSVYVDISDDGSRQANLVRADGSPLLPAYYLGASARRDQLAPGARLVFIMGREYADTFPDLVEVVRRFGLTELADGTEALYHGMVRVGTRKMSSRGDTVVDVDTLLDTVADRLRAGWGDDLGPFESEVCEQLAVALVKYHFLRVPRLRDVSWDETEVWSKTLPRFVALVRTLAGSRSGRSRADRRALLLLLDSLPEAVAETVARRDPSHLVRLADAVVEQAGASDDAGVQEATVVVLRRALALLNVALPPYLGHLPPPFGYDGVLAQTTAMGAATARP